MIKETTLSEFESACRQLIDEATGQSPIKLRGMCARTNGEHRARVSVYLDPSVALRLKRLCLKQGEKQSDIAAVAIERYLNVIEEA